MDSVALTIGAVTSAIIPPLTRVHTQMPLHGAECVAYILSIAKIMFKMQRSEAHKKQWGVCHSDNDHIWSWL